MDYRKSPGVNMPLFSGLEGEKFQFDGIPNRFFNLLTDEDIQVNAYFNSHNRIDLIGVKIGESKIKWSAQDGKAEVNGKKLNHRAYIALNAQTYHTFVEIKPIIDPVCNTVLLVKSGKYKFSVLRNKNC
ncbi:MAG: hypothetical protein GTO02_02210, partial [Candidatus Dadabacteria bacterium]|nr:hypothetical protein [Candidatus Dadabacteria bacterium]